MDLLAWVDKKMKERGVMDYTVRPELISVPVSSTNDYFQKNDFYFLVGAFSSTSSPITGEIVSQDDAIALKPYLMNTICYKHQVFSGMVKIKNLHATSVLYVEFLIASPKVQ